MANDITPMTTNLAASGKTLAITSAVEFSVGNTDNRTPIVELAISAMAFDQMIVDTVNVEAAQADYNIWAAPSADLKARAVLVECAYGAGGVKVNASTSVFPISADDTLGNGFMLYCNPSGLGTATSGAGIDTITVDTDNESRFNVYVFV